MVDMVQPHLNEMWLHHPASTPQIGAIVTVPSGSAARIVRVEESGVGLGVTIAICATTTTADEAQIATRAASRRCDIWCDALYNVVNDGGDQSKSAAEPIDCGKQSVA